MAISLLNAGPSTIVAEPSDLPYALVEPGEWEFSGSDVQSGHTYTIDTVKQGSVYLYILKDDGTQISEVSGSEDFETEVDFGANGDPSVDIVATVVGDSLPGHLLDRAVNLVSASSTTSLVLPPKMDGKVRDFMVRLNVTDSSQQVSFSARSIEPTVTWLGGQPPSSFDVGVHLISISESADGEFVFIDGMSEDFETVTNKVTSIDALSTDAQYPSAKCVYNALALKADKSDLSAKADKSEMIITPGTGANADKTTIQLKSGTSATVLTQHQDISGKANTGDIHNATITITQGGVTKGTFTLNQSTDQTIALDAGGGGGGGGGISGIGLLYMGGSNASGDQTITVKEDASATGKQYIANSTYTYTIPIPAGYIVVPNYDGYSSDCSASKNGASTSLPGTFTMEAGDSWAIYWGSCLSLDSKILMADDSSVYIKDIKENFYIKSPFGIDVVIGVSSGEKDFMDVWKFDDGTVIKTVGRHRFFNAELEEPMYLEAWNIGEHAVRHDMKRVALVSHERVIGKFKHASLVTEKYNLYYANGLLAGNRRSIGYKEIKV